MEALTEWNSVAWQEPGRPGPERDRQLVCFVGRHGLVAMRHVMDALGVGRTAAYRRVAACEERGLIERLEILRSEAGLLRATRDGLRYAGLGVPRAKVSPGTVNHMLRCTTVGRQLEAQHGPDRVLTERELRFAEQVEGKKIASAEVGEYRGGPRLHRPDLVVVAEIGTIAVEVELTPKSPARLQSILRGWKWEVMAKKVAEVRYLCAPGEARRAVERAVAKINAENHIVIAEAPSR